MHRARQGVRQERAELQRPAPGKAVARREIARSENPRSAGGHRRDRGQAGRLEEHGQARAHHVAVVHRREAVVDAPDADEAARGRATREEDAHRREHEEQAGERPVDPGAGAARAARPGRRPVTVTTDTPASQRRWTRKSRAPARGGPRRTPRASCGSNRPSIARNTSVARNGVPPPSRIGFPEIGEALDHHQQHRVREAGHEQRAW